MRPAHYLKDENFICIHAWMVNRLNLKGNELLLYACIYSFTQSESGCFSGSLQYLAEWCRSTRASVHRYLKHMTEQNLLTKRVKTVNGIRCVFYTAVCPEPLPNAPQQTAVTPEPLEAVEGMRRSARPEDSVPPESAGHVAPMDTRVFSSGILNLSTVEPEALSGGIQDVTVEETAALPDGTQGVTLTDTGVLPGGIQGVTLTDTGVLPGGIRGVTVVETNNKENNKRNNKGNNKKKKKEGKSAARFTPPSLEEVREYCQERNNGINPEAFLDYYAARGWELGHGRKVKDWKACLRTWERNGYGSGYAANDYTAPAGTDDNDPFGWERSLNRG